MSTKTLRKRIALVAVVALGAGVLASAPANAAVAGGATMYTVQNNGGSATAESLGVINTLDSQSTTAVAGGSDNAIVSGDLTATGKIQVGGRLALVTAGTHAATGVTIRVTGGTVGSFSGDAAVINTAGTVVNGDGTAGSTTADAVTIALLPSGGVGSQMTVEVWDAYGANATTAGSYLAGATADVILTMTVVAAGAQAVFAPTNSSTKFAANASYTDTATTYGTVDEAGATYVDHDETGATITFKAFDAYGVDLPLALITCSATGAVLTSVGSQSATNFLSSSSSALQTTGVGYCSIKRAVANTAASSVVTISVNGVVFGSRSLTFVGEAASISVTTPKFQKSEAVAKTDSFYFTVKDSAGNLLSSKAVTQDSARYNAFVTTATAGSTAAYNAALPTSAGWTCSTTEGSATLRLKTLKADGITAVYSPDFVANCYGDPDSYSASFDKASYVPGDIATLTITAKSEKGNPTNDYAVLGAAGYDVSIAGSNMSPVVTPTNTDKFSKGSKTYKFIVGSTEGSYNMVVNLPNWNYTGGPQPLTVAYKVAGSGAVSNADVLKAIVSLIASINKQIAALQKALLKK
jgi:trimeric autotransporter adhesin